MPRPDAPASTFQQQFHARWNHLTDPHVRTLAWLLDAPDLLDAQASPWHGRIVSLGAMTPDTEEWLCALDHAPAGLHAYLDLHPFTRLGRYAEKLMAYYLEHQGLLVAHGVQVHGAKGETIGEFDFLVRQGEALVHWEFVTKLYLLESSGQGRHADYFVGPNLADTLGAKIRKIMDRQLSLSQHPAARTHLPQPIAHAQALVKGWLFYHGQTPRELPQGIASAHCFGFWCALEELAGIPGEHYLMLSRLSWLAPARAGQGQVVGRHQLEDRLTRHFQEGGAPVLVAVMAPEGQEMLEVDRGFIVPDDWRSRAETRVGGSDQNGRDSD
ncbi:MAG TPA: DUF1853 family protein [Noviherbaspirillum sp.]